MTLNISDEVQSLMEERGIKEEDIQNVVDYGEGGDKLVDEAEGVCLAKKRINDITFNVVYKPDGDVYEVLNAYCHRVSLAENQ